MSDETSLAAPLDRDSDAGAESNARLNEPAPEKPRLLSLRRLSTPSAILIVTTVGGNMLRIVNTMILTRLLSPGDFGLAGMILSVFFVVQMITDIGFYAFVVRHERGDEPHFLNAVWTLHLTRGVINSVGVMLLSVPIAHLLGKPQLAPLLAVASLTLAIDGTASLTLFTSVRQGLVRRLSMVEIGAQLTQFVIGIAAAAYFRSVWAIITAMLAGSIFKSIASYTVFPDARRRPTLDLAVGSELWKFSRAIAASSMLTLALAQVDKLVLARLFSLVEFGTYVIASNLALAPTALGAIYVARIFYPQVSRAWREDPTSMRSAYYNSRGIVFFGYLICAGGLIGGAPLLIRVLYDPRYAGASIYLQMLAIASAMSILTRSIQEGLVATGRTRMTLLMNVARIAWLAIAGPIGFLQFGALGLVGTLALIEVPAYLYGLWVIRGMGFLSVRRELLSLALIAGGAAVGTAVSMTAAYLFPQP